jgi:hypothetical protein
MTPVTAIQNLHETSRQIDQVRSALQRGDVQAAARAFARGTQSSFHLGQNLAESRRMMKAVASGDTQRMADYFRACFASGTPILGEFGSKPIEDYRIGDRVWARAEHDPACPVELKPIEEVFVRQSTVWHVHVGDHVIRTSDEHPFWVAGKGWIKANELRIGDVLVGRTGKLTPVTDLLETGEIETVYNFRVADHHTYFVGGAEWGFDVWAHNQCMAPRSRPSMEKKTGEVAGVGYYGTPQVTSNPEHARRIVQEANRVLNENPTRLEGSYVVYNRSWRTVFGGGSVGSGATFGAGSTLRPDAIVVINMGGGRFRAIPIEVASQDQTVAFLRGRVAQGQSSLPTGVTNITTIDDAVIVPYTPPPS